MKLRYIAILLSVILSPYWADAHQNCGAGNKKRAQAKTTVATPEENDYDVKGLKFDIALSNTSTAVSGSVITYARTNIAGFTVYAFELDNLLVIDSIKINNQLQTAVTTGAVRKVTLSNALPVNTDFTAQVFYHGQTPSGNGQFFTGGLNTLTVNTGTKIMYSLSDPDYADDWWPCKQSLLDKIDSVTMWITVDDTLKAGSNGLLQKVTPMPGNKSRYEWKTTYLIDYYLICAAVAPYVEYNYYMHYTDGSNDSMLVQNYVYDSSLFFTPANTLLLDSTGLMIDHFSKVFGKYPFHQEKYGHCMTDLVGGMEHQTMTFMSTHNIRTTLIAHELGHQWWGNSVTYGKWEDIWLSEGMATYTELLYLENYWGAAAAQSRRSAVYNDVMSKTFGSVWVNDTTNVNRIFDGRLTYNKGAAVAHMLRYIAPHDSLFFVGLRTFQQQYKYGTALTADFKTVMEQTYNIPLDSFFRQWVYGEGFPTYAVKWEQANNVVHIKILQTTSHASVKNYHMPLQVRFNSLSGDTTVTVNMDDTAKHFIFVWDKNMAGVTIDPNDHVVNRTGTVQRDPSLLSVKDNQDKSIIIYPNPATDGWHIEYAIPGTSLKLYNIGGQLLWQGTATGKSFIPAQKLPQGSYLLQMHTTGAEMEYRKLLK